jgi:hypothetical protein
MGIFLYTSRVGLATGDELRRIKPHKFLVGALMMMRVFPSGEIPSCSNA